MTDYQLDKLTTAVTAFGSWAEFEAAMTGNGERQAYSPTLRPSGLPGNAERAFDRKVRALAAEISRRGFLVFVGQREANAATSRGFRGRVNARKRFRIAGY